MFGLWPERTGTTPLREGGGAATDGKFLVRDSLAKGAATGGVLRMAVAETGKKRLDKRSPDAGAAGRRTSGSGARGWDHGNTQYSPRR